MKAVIATVEQAAEAHRFAESSQKAGPIVLKTGALAAL